MRSADTPLAGAVTAASRRGPAHGQNEDRWALLGSDDLLLLAVADGMGGTVGGGTAAGIALRSLLELVDFTPAQAADPDPTATPSDPANAPDPPDLADRPDLADPANPLDLANPRGAVNPLDPANPRGAANPPDPANPRGAANPLDPPDPPDPDTTLEPLPVAGPVNPMPRAAPALPTDPVGDALAAAALATAPARNVQPAAVEAVEGQAVRAVTAAMRRAHERVRAAAPAGLPDALRPGSTFTMALVLGDRLVVGHVGDSGCWLLRRGALIRLTEVHTYAAVLVGAGAVNRDSPAARRLDNLLTRHLGMPGELRPQLATARLYAGDRLLLASDGLSRALPAPVLAALLARPDTSAGRLVGAAAAAGARDDVTALVATVGEPASGYPASVGAAAAGPASGPGYADLAAPGERRVASQADEPRAAAGR